jgi:hypothetical protein
MKLQHLTFTTGWVKGIHNIEADILSRHPCAQASDEDELDEEIKTAKINLLHLDQAELLCHITPVANSAVSAANIRKCEGPTNLQAEGQSHQM